MNGHIDWLIFGWAQGTGLGLRRSSLADRAERERWEGRLTALAEPRRSAGAGAAVSVCRLVWDDRVIALHRVPAGDPGAQTTTYAYLGEGPAFDPRAVLATVETWRRRIPGVGEGDERIDAARLDGLTPELRDRCAEAARRGPHDALRRLAAEVLRDPDRGFSCRLPPGTEPALLLWGLIDLLDEVISDGTGRYWTFSTGEDDDTRAVLPRFVFLDEWRHSGLRPSHFRLDLAAPPPPGRDPYLEVADALLDAYRGGSADGVRRLLGRVGARRGGLGERKRIARLLAFAEGMGVPVAGAVPTLNEHGEPTVERRIPDIRLRRPYPLTPTPERSAPAPDPRAQPTSASPPDRGSRPDATCGATGVVSPSGPVPRAESASERSASAADPRVASGSEFPSDRVSGAEGVLGPDASYGSASEAEGGAPGVVSPSGPASSADDVTGSDEAHAPGSGSEGPASQDASSLDPESASGSTYMSETASAPTATTGSVAPSRSSGGGAAYQPEPGTDSAVTAPASGPEAATRPVPPVRERAVTRESEEAPPEAGTDAVTGAPAAAPDDPGEETEVIHGGDRGSDLVPVTRPLPPVPARQAVDPMPRLVERLRTAQAPAEIRPVLDDLAESVAQDGKARAQLRDILLGNGFFRDRLSTLLAGEEYDRALRHLVVCAFADDDPRGLHKAVELAGRPDTPQVMRVALLQVVVAHGGAALWLDHHGPATGPPAAASRPRPPLPRRLTGPIGSRPGRGTGVPEVPGRLREFLLPGVFVLVMLVVGTAVIFLANRL